VKAKRIFFAALGLVCLGLGTAGVFLPVLPTVPFYLLTLFFFANSSERLHTWFLGTELYHRHLESYVQNRSMRLSAKLSVLGSLTLLMGLGFFLMARKSLWIPCGILAAVWLGHVLYFVFRVKTVPNEASVSEDRRADAESVFLP